MADGAPKDRFFAVLSSILNVTPEALGPESSRDSLEEWDSIKHLYVMLALEEEFSVEFSEEEFTDLASASALLQAIAVKTVAAETDTVSL